MSCAMIDWWYGIVLVYGGGVALLLLSLGALFLVEECVSERQIKHEVFGLSWKATRTPSPPPAPKTAEEKISRPWSWDEWTTTLDADEDLKRAARLLPREGSDEGGDAHEDAPPPILPRVIFKLPSDEMSSIPERSDIEAPETDAVGRRTAAAGPGGGDAAGPAPGEEPAAGRTLSSGGADSDEEKGSARQGDDAAATPRASQVVRSSSLLLRMMVDSARRKHERDKSEEKLQARRREQRERRLRRSTGIRKAIRALKEPGASPEPPSRTLRRVQTSPVNTPSPQGAASAAPPTKLPKARRHRRTRSAGEAKGRGERPDGDSAGVPFSQALEEAMKESISHVKDVFMHPERRWT